MNLLQRLAASAIACGWTWTAATAHAAVVTAGMHVLAPNSPGQQVPILVAGGEAVAGVDFFVQIGDGGAAVGGADEGPTITGVDLLSGAIFGPNNTGVFLDPAPLIWGGATTTAAGTVAANGRLATITVDTTGFQTGRFDLILNPPATGPTLFPGVETTLVNGWLQIGAQRTADFDADGDVDAADLAQWKTGVGKTVAATRADGDADGDADVDGADFLAWQQQLAGAAAARAASAAPEPHAFVLWTMGMLALARRVTRRP